MSRSLFAAVFVAVLVSACQGPATTAPPQIPTLVSQQVPTSSISPSQVPVVLPTVTGTGQTLVASPLPVNSPAATSQKLEDENLGIRFEYPSDWQLLARASDAPPGVTLHAPPFGPGPEPIIFAITVDVVAPDASSVRTEVDEQLSQVPEEMKGSIQRRSVTIGGEPGEEVIGLPSRSGAVETFVVHGGKLYLIILQPYDPANELLAPRLEGARAAYDRVVSTWQFTK